MPDEPQSSEAIDPADPVEEILLAILTACQSRGALSADELGQLLGRAGELVPHLDRLSEAGLLEVSGERRSITRKGSLHLDQLLEALERALTPDSPALERRYRREAPSLPFAANTVWAESVCANFRLDPAALRPLVPEVFELDLHGGYAWVSLTASRLKDFGMGSLPGLLRMNFYQATYRVHVTFSDFRGRKMRGCYFLRSETNSPLMSLTANLLPEFKDHRCAVSPIAMLRRGTDLVLTVDPAADREGSLVLVLDTAVPPEQLPAGSAFASLGEAYDFIVDFHDAFAFDRETGEVFILRIDRGDWPIEVVSPVDQYVGLFEAGPFQKGAADLDSVFYFADVPYRWLPLLKETYPWFESRRGHHKGSRNFGR